MTAEKELERLIGALGHRGRPGIRLAAAEALGQIGDSRAAGPLVAALKDMDSRVRRAAVRALGNVGSPAVEPLLTALEDEDPDVSDLAATALGLIGDRRAVVPLLAVFADRATRLAGAARALRETFCAGAPVPLRHMLGDAWFAVPVKALANIGAPAVEPLLAVLRDGGRDTPLLRELAVRTLGDMDDPRAVELLLSTLKDPDPHVREAAAQSLERLGWLEFDKSEAHGEMGVP